MEKAKQIYSTMIQALNNRDWKYDGNDEELYIISGYKGEDVPIRFMIRVDDKREVVQFLSPMPFTSPEEKRVDMAIAVSFANYGMVNGCFDYDMTDGEIRFRLTTSYCDCQIGEGFFMDMIATAVTTIEKYNDRFLGLCDGNMSLDEFIRLEQENK